MRAIAAFPASALLAGAAFGLFDPEPHVFLTHVLIAASVAAAALGFARRRRWLLAAAASLGFFTGGSLLSSVEWQRAWRPPLRVAFEELARAEREAAAAQGRRMPEDDEAFGVVTGVLHADAARTESGVLLSLNVDGLERRDGQEERDGPEAPAATPSRGQANPRRGVGDRSPRGGGPARRRVKG